MWPLAVACTCSIHKRAPLARDAVDQAGLAFSGHRREIVAQRRDQVLALGRDAAHHGVDETARSRAGDDLGHALL